jgi:hypothetical protein
MRRVTGHVFVVRGTLQGLVSDDVLVSSDSRAGAGIGPHFWPAFGWSQEEGAAKRTRIGSYPPERRVFLAQAEATNGPRRWVVNVGADARTPVSWLLDGVREALATVAQEGDPVRGRPRRIALPVMGVGHGGFDGRRGEVIHGLLDEAQRAAGDFGVDVVLVAARASDYSAFQALRADGHVPVLEPALEKQAHRLAALARSGQLAVFMGAGTGVAAGLPLWDDLLKRLAKRVGLPDATWLEDLGPLDAAELLRRLAARGVGEGAGESVLGQYVVEEIKDRDRYALSHAFLAALDADQVITTNFAQLYEMAVKDIRGDEPLVVLPETDPSEVTEQRGRRSWLLKLHGDVGTPGRIVLDRRSFVRYDAGRRPLGGALQTTLLTRHLLVVGASMTDDNVIRLIHEVAELTGTPQGQRPLGTVLSLGGNPLRAELWDPEFSYVDLGVEGGDIPAAARRLEIFLDRLAMLTAPRTTHLLDPRYSELLQTEAERRLAARVADVVAEVRRLPSGADPGWRELVDRLSALGVPGPDDQ